MCFQTRTSGSWPLLSRAEPAAAARMASWCFAKARRKRFRRSSGTWASCTLQKLRASGPSVNICARNLEAKLPTEQAWKTADKPKMRLNQPKPKYPKTRLSKQTEAATTHQAAVSGLRACARARKAGPSESRHRAAKLSPCCVLWGFFGGNEGCWDWGERHGGFYC